MPSPRQNNASLRARVLSLRAELQALQSRPAPPPAPSPELVSLLSTAATQLHQSSASSPRKQTNVPTWDVLAETEAWARGFRMSGQSCFPVELDVGKRARESIEARGKGKGRQDSSERWVRKGVAVRLETFHQGRFFEPYYVVFGYGQDGEGIDLAGSQTIAVIHHTIPHWIPLQQLAKKYLGISTRGEDEIVTFEEDGDELDPSNRSDMPLFLTRLTTYLNAYVSRREQLASLRTTFTSPPYDVHDFRFSSSTPCDRIVVEYIDPAAGDPSDDEPDEVERLIVFEFVFPDPRVDLLERHSILARRVARSATTGSSKETLLTAAVDSVCGTLGVPQSITNVLTGLFEYCLSE